MTKAEFNDVLSSMDNDEVTLMLNYVLKSCETKHRLRKVFTEFVSEDPRFFAQRIADLKEFKMAKLGGFLKMSQYIREQQRSKNNKSTV